MTYEQVVAGRRPWSSSLGQPAWAKRVWTAT